MGTVDVNINEAAVTAVHEFGSYKGWGIDFFIKVQSSDCTVYLQVVLYDEEARRKSSYIHEGDFVRVVGILKDKPYQKKDGTAGHSLLIERPIVFDKIVGRNSNPQKLHYSEQNGLSGSVSALAETAESEKKQELSKAADIAETEMQESASQGTTGYSNGLKKIVIDDITYEAYENDDEETAFY